MRKLQNFVRDAERWSSHTCKQNPLGYGVLRVPETDFYRKFEHSKTFGLVTSASSNAVWTRDEDASGTARRTGAGRAIVGAGEEVLCWDVKKGELLSRWRDANCNAEVTAITQSKADQDIFAVG